MGLEMEPKQISSRKLEDFAPSVKRVALAGYGSSVYSKPGSYRCDDFIVLCENYGPGLRTYNEEVDERETRYLFVEKNLVESDVKKGTLGDFLTEKFLYPYRPIVNTDYLQNLGLTAKARVVKEEVKDLVLEYGEMCRGLEASPEFFGLSKMRKRARIFLPSMIEYLRFLDPSVRRRNLAELEASFRIAISANRGDLVEVEGERVTIQDSAVDKWLKDRASERVVNILTQSHKAFNSYLSRGRAIYLNPELMARELYTPLRLVTDPTLAGKEPEDPKNHLYLRTADGVTSLNERASLEDLMSRIRPGQPITISPLGGVLNEVHMVTLGREQFVVKKFTDWHGFKWFTVNLISFGSKFFAVSGKTRMANEYGMNRYLANRGAKVPRIIQINVNRRVLVEKYVAGIPLNRIFAKAVNQTILTQAQWLLVESLGSTLGRIHEIGVSIGDAKPENFVSSDDGIFTVDLEQAGKSGDYAWDIAVLLFYAGHYSRMPLATRGLREMIDAFIAGYLGRGDSADLRRAAGVKYTKVFSMLTPAPILMEIATTLRKAA